MLQLKRGQGGEDVVITVSGRPVARLSAIETRHRRWIPAIELAERLVAHQADPGLRGELADLVGEQTGDVGSIR